MLPRGAIGLAILPSGKELLHRKAFTERFAGFPVKIKQLSKFTKSSEVKDIKRGLKVGEVDIVIGTHALLAKDIEFARLGLVIIDEEQHFVVM